VKLKLPEMRTGLAISAVVHLALLLWGIISFSAKPLEARPNDALPIDIISDKQFSELTKGVKNAPKTAKPAPFAEKVGPSNPIDDSSAKVTPKKEIQAARTDAQKPPPPPEPEQKPKPSEAKPAEAKPAEAKPAEAKPAEAKPEKKPEQAIDPIAETLKKEEAKKKAEEREQAKKKVAEERAAKAKAEKLEREKKQAEAYDPSKIAALLDKRDPTRQAAAGEQLSPNPGIGKSNGNAAVLSQSELDALRKRLQECWNPPVGAMNASNLKVVMRVFFKPDGSVAAQPQLVAGTASPFGPAMAESAKRAILTCQPFKMLRPETYDLWKDIEITFDPKDMFGG
jgi:TolA protein